jgi:hypothetical protein
MKATTLWPLLTASSFLIGGLAGYFIGERPAPAPAAAPNVRAPSFTSSHGTAEPLPLTSSAQLAPARELPVATEEQGGNIDQALREALREPNEIKRQHALYDLVLKMSPAELSAAIKSAQQMSPGQERETLLPLLASRWAESDPAAAMQFVLGIPENQRGGAMRAALSS